MHHGSALSPSLFTVLMAKATKECRRGDPRELLHVDNLELIAETKDDVVAMFRNRKRAMEKRDLNVNIDKTKIMVTDKKMGENVQMRRYPCGV